MTWATGSVNVLIPTLALTNGPPLPPSPPPRPSPPDVRHSPNAPYGCAVRRHVTAYCYSAPRWNQSLWDAPGAASAPTARVFQLDTGQDGCVNVTGSAPPSSSSGSSGSSSSKSAAAAATATSAAADSGLLLQPPLLSRCWASRGVFIDVGLRGASVDRYENPAPTSYDVVLTDVTYSCAAVMTTQCLADHGGSLGCVSWLNQRTTAQMLPWRLVSLAPPPPTPTLSPPPPPTPPAGALEHTHQDGGDGVMPGAAIGGAIGGGCGHASGGGLRSACRPGALRALLGWCLNVWKGFRRLLDTVTTRGGG
jgi:hypothetical protein